MSGASTMTNSLMFSPPSRCRKTTSKHSEEKTPETIVAVAIGAIDGTKKDTLWPAATSRKYVDIVVREFVAELIGINDTLEPGIQFLDLSRLP